MTLRIIKPTRIINKHYNKLFIPQQLCVQNYGNQKRFFRNFDDFDHKQNNNFVGRVTYHWLMRQIAEQQPATS